MAETEKKAPAKKTAAKKTPAKSAESGGSDKATGPNLSSGRVLLRDLKMQTRNSDSVRRLQTALGTNVTGNYDRSTQLAVRSWQNSHGFEGGRGIQVGAAQAKLLFGDDYEIR